ncbi:MAG: Asp23/Gls24 family envelope stress response protein [Bacillaceae bacterium]|nr:Asp23/Gls24 family envelope stress response protein [Bacillaceae bacterium]
MDSVIDHYDRTELGKIEIAPEVIEIIAGLAAGEIDGVVQLSGNLVGDLAERFGRKNLGKGVRVDIGQKEAAIDISVVIEFGRRIPDVAGNIQENVQKAIESMTGLHVVEVNVHVVDVEFTEKESDDPAEIPEEKQRVR